MVELVVLQSLSYMAGALGVCIAAIYYMVNLREMNKNRRITLTTTMMQPFMTEEGVRQLIDLINMEWSDLDDFKNRYDSRVNPESYAKRISIWNICENCGRLYREGLLDIETLYGGSAFFIQLMWVKFKPVIEMYRKSDFTKDHYRNFEYVAEKLNEFHMKRSGEDYNAKLQEVIQSHKDTQIMIKDYQR
jgi:hypothetical protein